MKKVLIAIKEPGKPWEPKEVEDTLESYQRIVGGYIEHFYTAPDGLELFCNEEGKLKNLKFNFRFGRDFIFGTVFACRSNEDGEMCSLMEKDLANLN